MFGDRQLVFDRGMCAGYYLVFGGVSFNTVEGETDVVVETLHTVAGLRHLTDEVEVLRSLVLWV